MSQAPSTSRPIKMLVFFMAAIGFLFDNYELTLMPLTIRSVVADLAGFAPGTPGYGVWAGRLLFIPACAGGLLGLLGGRLIDLFGRRRVLTWSILIYAASAFAVGFCTSIWQFLALRCLTVSAVFVEYVAATAWLAEIFEEPKDAARALGYSQVFSSVGGLLAAVANSQIVHLAPSLPSVALPDTLRLLLGDIAAPHASWRYLYMSGLLPALPLILIRPFLPESPRWEKARREGSLKRPSYRELFQPELLRNTLASTLLCACMIGMAYGGLWQIAQAVPRLTEGDATFAALPEPARKEQLQLLASRYVTTYELGAIAGRFLLALLAPRITNTRRLYLLLHLPATLLVPLAMLSIGFMQNKPLLQLSAFTLTELHVLIFIASTFLIAQVSFWGNVLPRLFPLHLRGSGESLAYNVGGRMVGAACAAVTSNLAVTSLALGNSPAAKIAFTSAAVSLTLALLSLLVSLKWPRPLDNTA